MERSKTRFNWLAYILTLVYRDTALVSVLQEAGVFDTKSQTCIRQTDAILEQCIYIEREGEPGTATGLSVLRQNDRRRMVLTGLSILS